MDRLFLDADVLLSAAYRIDAGLVRLWKLKDATLCSSRYALEEARNNLPDEHQRERLTALSEPLERLEVGGSTLPRGIFLPK
jgi:hypothetical protein